MLVSVCNVPHIVNGYGDHAKHLEPGQLLKIKCYPGYDLHVMSQVTCQEDGTFGSSIIPDCESKCSFIIHKFGSCIIPDCESKCSFIIHKFGSSIIPGWKTV